MPKIKASKLKLDYPLYACDFDPNNASRLVVAGGGGAGKDGVKNKIVSATAEEPSLGIDANGTVKTALQAFDQLAEVDTLDIGKDNDNVTSLAVGGTVDNATFVYAGVNSGPAELEKGKNEHFRIYVMGKSTGGKRAGIEEASRATLFKSKDKSTYQRILRLSRPHADGAQLGAAATGFGAPHELVIFDSIVANPRAGGRRGVLELDKEAADVDVIEIGKNNYLVAYCDNHEVYLKQIGGAGDAEAATSIFAIPGTERDKNATGVATFRSLRFLTREFIAVVANRPGRSGAYIQILRIIPSEDGGITSRVAQTLALHKKIPQASGLTVANLNPPVSVGGKQNNTQFIIAVPDQNSISLISMDYQVLGGASIVTQPRRLTRLKEIHPAQITGISLQFFSPALAAQRATQILRLASVSVEGTTVMHHLPLFKDPKKEDSHYRIALLPENNSGVTPSGLASILGMLFVVLLSQTILELAERVPPYLQARERFPPAVVKFLSGSRRAEGDAYAWERTHQASSGGAPTKFLEFAEHPIASLLDSLRAASTDGQQIVIRPSTPEALDGDVIDNSEHLATINKDDAEGAREAVERDIRAKIELHDEEVHGKVEGKTWEELGHEQKEAWLERLREIGHWAGELPQTVFKGVIFSEIAGAVGRGVAGQ